MTNVGYNLPSLSKCCSRADDNSKQSAAAAAAAMTESPQLHHIPAERRLKHHPPVNNLVNANEKALAGLLRCCRCTEHIWHLCNVMQRGRVLDPGMQQLLGLQATDCNRSSNTDSTGGSSNGLYQTSSPLRCDLTELAGNCNDQQC